MLTHWILAMLMVFPPCYRDKNEPNRSERMATIASAIDDATARATCSEPFDVPDCSPMWSRSQRELAAMLVTKGWWESRFASNVHAGRCGPEECDAIRYNGIIVHRARSPWQLQRTSFTVDEWSKMVGTDIEATRHAAFAASKILSEGMVRCKTVQGALSWYGAGRCMWSGSARRHRTFRKLMAVPLP